MLAVEVLVETPHRLLGPVDHFLNGELRRGLLGNDLTGRIEEPLDPLGRPLAGRPGRSLDRSIPPDRVAAPPIGRCAIIAIDDKRGGADLSHSDQVSGLKTPVTKTDKRVLQS